MMFNSEYSADVAELVDALDLGSSVFGREGSSPFIRIYFGSLRVVSFTIMFIESRS